MAKAANIKIKLPVDRRHRFLLRDSKNSRTKTDKAVSFRKYDPGSPRKHVEFKETKIQVMPVSFHDIETPPSGGSFRSEECAEATPKLPMARPERDAFKLNRTFRSILLPLNHCPSSHL